MSSFLRIPYQEMLQRFENILIRHGFPEKSARQCALIFTNSSLDGIYTHGVNRFAKFIEDLLKGVIKVKAKPKKIASTAGIEQWNGNLGPGPLNAVFATNRVIQVAKKFSIACLALANTNHWMRGGTYGWQAAKEGYVFIGWTNTLANMSAWGARDNRLGNNPLVLAVPYGNEAIVLDMAMSQFSYGKMHSSKIKGEKLPLAGGYDTLGNLTDDPGEILKSERALPMGYWKGAGLSLLLDILATVLSGGLSVKEISALNTEHALSQVFIAIDISRLKNYPAIQDTIQAIIRDYLQSVPQNDLSEIIYPGQHSLKARTENMEKGIPVNKEIWNKIMKL